MAKEKKLKIKITDTTLRDAQQSLWTKHLNIEEILPLLSDLDECGFDALEVWGGGTFEAALKFWDENPWVRLKTIKKNIKKTPLQMIVRGRNLVGYHTYSNEIIEAFLQKSFDFGITRIRIFDPLNDIENIKFLIKIAKESNIDTQGVICYTMAPNYDLEFFATYANQLKSEGVNAITIKDPAGILTPKIGVELVKTLQQETKLPINLHSHATNGIVNLTYYDLIQNKINGIDCSLGLLSFPSAQPSIENILKMFEGEEERFDVNVDKIYQASKKLSELYYQKEALKPFFPINPQDIFLTELTRGSFTFLYEQLKKRNVLNKFPKVLDEIIEVRKDLGFPPMIVPISQIIVAQAVYNVLMEKRYKLIPTEIKELLKGGYGKIRNPINEDLTNLIKKDSNVLDTHQNLNISLRKIKESLPDELIDDETDFITYALFPELSLEYFKYRKNPNVKKEEFVKPVTAEEEVLVLNKLMQEKNIVEFELNEDSHYISIKKFSDETDMSHTYMPTQYHSAAPSQNANTSSAMQDAQKTATSSSEDHESIKSPIVGIFYSKPNPNALPFVKKGDTVDEGMTLCIIEAMKVLNEIKAPFKCKIVDILLKDKDSVESNQNLFYIEKV